MTRIEIRKTNGHSGAEGAAVEGGAESRWAHPIQALREILHWDDIARALPHRPLPEAGFVPDFDVRETAEAFVFEADLPGVDRRDLVVRIEHNRLIVSGGRAPETVARGETVHALERFAGAFTRSFTLPETADAEHVEAHLENGVLTLTLPKKPEARARRVPVK